jgi:hypothetical protein
LMKKKPLILRPKSFLFRRIWQRLRRVNRRLARAFKWKSRTSLRAPVTASHRHVRQSARMTRNHFPVSVTVSSCR